jgi:hypothetical protein
LKTDAHAGAFTKHLAAVTPTRTSARRLAGLLTALLLAGSAHAQNVANAVAVEGTVFVTRADGKQSLLTRGSNLQRGEAINTARNSSVRLRFSDGGETVVRPESSLVVRDYQFQQDAPAQDSLILQLLKGGLRAVTGAVGKRGNADAYRVRVTTATIGIRGTDYSVRLCQSDCADVPGSAQRNSATPVAARAVQVLGKVTFNRGLAAAVPLTEQTPLYSGDTVETAGSAFAVLVFRDNARVTVNPGTRFVITQYSYDPAPKAEPGYMFIELLKGGLRFATGLLGKRDPSTLKVRTATATIGIRGTVFDLVCAPGAAPDRATTSDVGTMACDESLLAQTREGTISLAGDTGDAVLIPAGQAGRVDREASAARMLPESPGYFGELNTPLPESVPADMDQLFGVAAAAEPEDGVFLMVHEGRVQLSQESKDLTLDAGESAFAGRSLAPIKLFNAPPLLDRDPMLSGTMFSANMCRR